MQSNWLEAEDPIDWSKVLDEIAKANVKPSNLEHRRFLRAALDTLFDDHSDKSAASLEAMADDLIGLSGRLHITSANVILQMLDYFPICLDPHLVAQTIRSLWKRGRMGFQFMPNPASTTMDEYLGDRDWLEELLTGDPAIHARRLLAGPDRKFYDSLPERFTVYRGVAGCPVEMAALGLCWTVQRPVAEWFAWRAVRDGAEPILLSAPVLKRADVLTVFASEFEVVITARKWRRLKLSKRRLPARPEPIAFDG